MDFMKVFDQTVRDIKREVNLKVLKVPEIEQKVLDATSDEPWGPHGSALAELAKETKKFTECQMIMNVLWTRLADTGANWRHIYKALSVIEHLIANGSERAVDDIIEHTFQISSLSGFEFVEPNGKDMGINVRKKAETVSGILNDREKIKALRDKAAATRDKYFGLSSSGVSYKSSASSFGSSNFSQYGGFNVSKEVESQDGDESTRDYGSKNDGKKLKKEAVRRIRIKDSSSDALRALSKQNSESASKSSIAPMNPSEDDIDDFDPRASSRVDSGSSKQGNLSGDGLLIDLMDEPLSAPAQVTASVSATTEVETDLFANANFVSFPPASSDVKEVPPAKEVDLFAHQPAVGASVHSSVDLFDISETVSVTEANPVETKSDSASFDPFATAPLSTSSTLSPQAEAAKSSNIDPFAAVPLSNVDDSDFGAFASNVGSVQSQSSGGQETGSPNNVNQTSSPMSKQQTPKKDTFHVKSGIWADSLSRGLIDLNITAPKKVSLSGIGIVGDLDEPSDEKDKGLPGSMFMGKAMGPGAGLGWSAFPSSEGGGSGSGSSSVLNQQWGGGSFK